MRSLARFLPVALSSLFVFSPVALAQSTGSNYVMNYPVQSSTTIQGSVNNANQCLASQPANTLATPQTILAQLMAANKIPTDIVSSISLENSTTLNAYTNGKKIVVTSGLWNKLDTNDERAFVIGHELSHDVLNHIGKTQTRRVGLSIVNSLLSRYTGNSGLGNLAAQLGVGAIDKKYSRDYEYQADDLGVQLMSKAGFQPCGALNVFDVLSANTTKSRVPEFLQDHPLDKSRVSVLVKKYQLTSFR